MSLVISRDEWWAPELAGQTESGIVFFFFVSKVSQDGPDATFWNEGILITLALAKILIRKVPCKHSHTRPCLVVQSVCVRTWK